MTGEEKNEYIAVLRAEIIIGLSLVEILTPWTIGSN